MPRKALHRLSIAMIFERCSPSLEDSLEHDAELKQDAAPVSLSIFELAGKKASPTQARLDTQPH